MNPATIDPETTWTRARPNAFLGLGDGYMVTIAHTRWTLTMSGRKYRGEAQTKADAVTEARDIRRIVMGRPTPTETP